MIPAFRRTGAGGPTLVCHPGGPGFSSRLFADLDGLAAHLDLVLVDPRGPGATPRPDDARGPAAAREIAAGIPGAELALIPGAGHFVYVEQPRAFRDEILGFVPALAEEARA